MEKRIKGIKALKGEFFVEADKSISHRTILFSSLAEGKSSITNCLQAEDTKSTMHCLQTLGANISKDGSKLVVEGKGLHSLNEAKDILNCGNSGTTMRLLTGLLAAQDFFTVLSGDASLNRRPMQRIIEPLKLMGAKIWARDKDRYAPIAIQGNKLKGIEYTLPVASAQLKSALILAAMYAEDKTVIHEELLSRDHSERMLKVMGADIKVANNKIHISSTEKLYPQDFIVPGDISSAAFFIVAATIIPGSDIKIKDVGVNPSRTGLIDILLQMGAKIKLENHRIIGGEPIADILVSSADLTGIKIREDVIPLLVDEIPVLAVAMAVAKGESIVEGAGELRVKESDRIRAICTQLSKMGAIIEEREEGFLIQGKPGQFTGSVVDSEGDHRIAMSLAIAALLAPQETLIRGAEVVNISFPGFWEILKKLSL